MTRIDHRVEVVFPIENDANVRYVRDKMLDAYLNDNTRARIMREDGTYTRLKPAANDKVLDVQEFLMNGSRMPRLALPRLPSISDPFSGGL